MEPLAAGSPAPAIPGVDFGDGPRVVFFYKVTCPVCQMAAPNVQRFEEAYPGRIAGVGEDADQEIGAFGQRFGLTFPSVPDLPPYELSNAYGIRSVPTTFLVGSRRGHADRGVLGPRSIERGLRGAGGGLRLAVRPDLEPRRRTPAFPARLRVPQRALGQCAANRWEGSGFGGCGRLPGM